MPEFRYFGSIIEAALELGHDVELWHDYSQPREGIKGSQFPLIEKTPMLVGGPPKSLAYEGKTALNQMLAEGGADCVVASSGPVWYLNECDLSSVAVPWVGIQENLDYALYGLECITGSTIQCTYTPYWVNLVPKFYAKEEQRPALSDELKRKARFTGSTLADGAKSVDAGDVRSRWKIPAGRPVVLFLPSDREASLYGNVFLATNKLRQAKLIITAGRWRNLSYLRHDFSDRALVQSVRQFCDSNNAFMLVKTREKQPLPDYLRANADLIVFDDTEYPASILSALSVSDICISAYLSTSIGDAAVMGVPYIGIYRDDVAWPYSHRRQDMVQMPSEIFFRVGEGDYFNCPGFAYPMYLIDAIKKLGKRRISDYPLRLEALDDFITQYLGSTDGRNGHRVLNEIEALVSNGENFRGLRTQGMGEQVHPIEASARPCAGSGL